MQSNTRRPSLNTGIFKSIDKVHIQKAVKAYIEDLRRQHPEIERVIWFGSWVNGLPTPGSDVDICLIVSSCDKPARDRISDYLPLGFPTGIDLLVYTQDEFERIQETSPALHQAILSGVEV